MQTMMAFPGQVLMEYNQGDRPVPYMPEFLECRNGKVWPNGASQAESFFRFFPVPGMGHCNGGPGPISFDALAALERWHEQGIAPAQLLGRHLSNGAVDRSRPLCAFPSVARWNGVGSPDAAESFTCVAATPGGSPSGLAPR